MNNLKCSLYPYPIHCHYSWLRLSGSDYIHNFLALSKIKYILLKRKILDVPRRFSLHSNSCVQIKPPSLRRFIVRFNLFYFPQQSIRAKVKTSSKQKDVEKVFSGKVTEQYVSDCARLTWKMVMQRPQMKFGNDTKLPWKGNEKLLEPAWGSNLDAANCKLRYYKHPVLYHDKAVMVKGKVIIK